MGRIRRIAGIFMASLLLAALLGACASSDAPTASSASDDGGDSASVEELGAPAEMAQRRVAYGSAATTAGGSGGGTTTGGLAVNTSSGGTTTDGVASSLAGSPAVGPSVIKTAYVEVTVDKDGLDEATRSAISIAGRQGGFVLSTATRDDRSGSSTVVVRIPADSFERALADLEALGDVKSEEISGEDVSQEFVDMGARVRNLESQEAVLLRLMDRSVSVADTIRVQRELQGVQLEIERLTGRIRYLKDQADMGTISLSLVETGAPAHKPPAGVIAKAWARAVDVALAVVAAVIVGTGFLIPVAILAAIGFLALRALRPRFGAP